MPVPTPQSDQRSVRMVAGEEAAAIEAGDSKRYLSLLAPDALFMPPDSSPKSGHDLREWLREFVGQKNVEYLKLTDDETVVEGCLAYHRFTYRWKLTPKAGGEARMGCGKGIHILRRQPDGAWKIAREIWNATPDSTKGHTEPSLGRNT